MNEQLSKTPEKLYSEHKLAAQDIDYAQGSLASFRAEKAKSEAEGKDTSMVDRNIAAAQEAFDRGQNQYASNLAEAESSAVNYQEQAAKEAKDARVDIKAGTDTSQS